MPNATEPQTDRELLLTIHGSVENLCKEFAEIKNVLANTTDKAYCTKEHNRIDNKILDYGLRIRKLENWKWYVMGGFGVVAIFITIVFEYLKNS